MFYKKVFVSLFLLMLVTLLCACLPQSTMDTQDIIVEITEINPSAEIVCWGFTEFGDGYKVWNFTPAINGTWEELPVCETGMLSTSFSDALVEIDNKWVWSGVLSKIKKGHPLGSIKCDGLEQVLFAYTKYKCEEWSAGYVGMKISSEPLVFIPSHP